MSSADSSLAILLYHDVVEAGAREASGFSGGAAGLYKLTIEGFERHLAALRDAGVGPPALHSSSAGGWMLHFDDGGVSALGMIAPRLEALGWRGHFFVPTRYLGTRGFLDAAGLRELHGRGHSVGSHSWSHPERIHALPAADMLEEWRRSRGQLEAILGASVVTASVPGGFYSRAVARAAAQAGIAVLFNSEPVMRRRLVAGIEVWGRFNVNRRTRAESAVGLVRRRFHLRASQYLLWNAKKLAKRLTGPLYRRVRAAALEP
jgi:peptidoglycan/xylan/chitin deacetylase (PgdA/CDA1 family)